MPTQRCPNCGTPVETGVYVTGQRATCAACNLGFDVVRADVSELKVAAGAEPSSAQATLRVAPAGPVSATLVRPAIQIPGYELLELLGRGGMGEVWHAKQLSLGRHVAVKVLAANLAGDADFVKRFEKEAAALAALSHAGIVSIIDRGQVGGLPYFVMEYVHGQTLRELMEQKKLDASSALRVVVQVATAIESAHAHGIIHRDLKPENILIDTEGRVKVADFGLAGIRDARFNVTQTAMTMGTVNYMAPEQRKDAKNVDGRADVFSLGVMLYELITGEIPVGRFKLPSEKVPGLDPRLDAVVLRALEADPNARFQRARELIAALEGLLSTLTLPASALPDGVLPRPLSGAITAHDSQPATRPDAPDNVGTHPAELASAPDAPHASSTPNQVVTHVRRGWRMVRTAVMGMALIIGGLVIVSLVTGKSLVSVDDQGLTLLGHVNISGRKHQPAPGVDGGAVADALPPDTHRDVDVGLTDTTARGVSTLDSALVPGTAASLIALDGQWTTTPGGLIARVFDKTERKGDQPRASLEEPSFRIHALSAQVTVTVDPKPPTGYTPNTPRAVLFFHGEETLLELGMQLGTAPVYRVVNRFTDGSGKLRRDVAGDPAFNPFAPPPAGTPVTLQLTIADGHITAWANGKEILKRPLDLPTDLRNEVGRIGVGCEEATCQFSGLHVVGQAVRGRALLEGDAHEHTVLAAPAQAAVP